MSGRQGIVTHNGEHVKHYLCTGGRTHKAVIRMICGDCMGIAGDRGDSGRETEGGHDPFLGRGKSILAHSPNDYRQK